MNKSNPVANIHAEPVAKLLIIGDSAVGKTSIMNRFIDSFFTAKTTTTMMVDYKLKKVKIDDMEFKLQIWDTVGQEKYKAVTRNFYSNAMAVIVVFDVTNTDSLKNVRNWVRHARSQAGDNICRLLVGNKSDMTDERVVNKEEIKDLADELAMEFFEVSAKSGENINEAFVHISRDIKNKYFSDMKSQTLPENIKLTKEDDEGATSLGGCC